MFSVKELAAKSRTVLGKSLILLAISIPSYAEPSEPKFFEYSSGGFINRLTDLTFGWWKTLDTEQKESYHSALNHALMYSDNGQKVTWYKKDASGIAMPVMTWPNGNGYCRRMYIQAIAYGVEKTMSATACFDDVNNRWQWYNDKY